MSFLKLQIILSLSIGVFSESFASIRTQSQYRKRQSNACNAAMADFGKRIQNLGDLIQTNKVTEAFPLVALLLSPHYLKVDPRVFAADSDKGQIHVQILHRGPLKSVRSPRLGEWAPSTTKLSGLGLNLSKIAISPEEIVRLAADSNVLGISTTRVAAFAIRNLAQEVGRTKGAVREMNAWRLLQLRRFSEYLTNWMKGLNSSSENASRSRDLQSAFARNERISRAPSLTYTDSYSYAAAGHQQSMIRFERRKYELFLLVRDLTNKVDQLELKLKKNGDLP